MQVYSYNLYNEKINPKEIKLNISILYEIMKKYVANIKLENM